ncbi:Replication fork clamp-binding protein CrfC (dynamin-like GTPase family) [Atopomonas hussainii]|uniref:Replication fork clamp-binding protein CrfC (Dynamin-like GTPase family) n=1 Tax=Atopomonas hussainii TaxID=1429083 RepID=A0A1H7I7M5_9GAMM|nr:dynamin-like GTPase family protein [Atopomonas hussainii]SEK58506.1 Replication fork clamp-binding protein CrfC (dynamin-like GTPase family) [Atopomonas hussainii]
MSMERLGQQVDEYLDWKRNLARQITRYRSWLENNRLNSPDTEAKLDHALRILRQDQLTLAFVGEYSRGKTELINSLFFADFGQRMLPSQAGRTTMCPTEIFFDQQAGRPYIRLLPIETRMTEANVAQFKRIPRHWVNMPLDMDNPDNMAEAFAQVARTKCLPAEQAIALGFDPDLLEPAADKPGHVQVPAWRHALVSLDHPLLRRGLRILDTPGLNALGSEPELTLSMLPAAQAVFFMLSADTGVTASDMQVWEQHLRPLYDEGQCTLFAILNKIDVLWDDLAGDVFVDNAIRLVQQATSRQLNLPMDCILPLSAKQSLLAKVRSDQALLSRSKIGNLENLLCDRIVAQKEALLQERVVSQVLRLSQNSQTALQRRVDQLQQQLSAITHSKHDTGNLLFEMTAKAKNEHAQHHRRLLSLKTNQRLLKRQGDLLQAAIRSTQTQGHVTKVKRNLNTSWTTFGINQAILHFFNSLEADLHNLQHEAELANKMVGAIYKRHNEENPLYAEDPPALSIDRSLRQLRQIRRQADQFRLQLKTLLTEQHTVTRRFINTLAQEVLRLHRRLRTEVDNWTRDALTPLLQHSLEHKQLLEGHLLELKRLSQQAHQAQHRSEQLQRYLDLLSEQLNVAADIQRQLRMPAPWQRKAKVVSISQGQARA